MFRLGNTVMRFPVYHRRWREEKAEDGTPLTPPGIPQEWTGLWRKATDFQRCAIYAGVYMKALVEGVRDLPPRRYFIYSHDELKEHPAEVFGKMADFLGIEEEGFGAVLRDFMVFSRPVAPGLGKELKKIEREMELHRWEAALDALSRRVS
jgi:muconolactone delta-isomerase